MPTFHYTAKRGPTEVVEGTLEADNRNGVLSYLAEQGYVPVRIREGGAAGTAKAAAPVKKRRVPARHMTVFTRQFASLSRSQVPLLRSLGILEEQMTHPYFKHVLRGVTEGVRQGDTLSAGLGRFPDVFPALYTSLIRSGEVGGALDSVLEQLADQAERDEALRSKLRAAFTYPGFVAAVGFGTVVFLMTFVMPRLSQLLTGLGEHLPAPTRWLLAISGAMSTPWFWVGAVVLVSAGILAWRASGERGRWLVDRLTLRLPLIGPMILEVELARFARSFGLLLEHGVSVLHAIEVSVPVVRHRVIRAELATLPEGLRQGEALSKCLGRLSISNPYLVNTVAVGEEGGKAGEAMREVAAYYERNIERALATMASLLEPALIVIIGLIVGFIVMAVLLPIFEMSTISR